MLFSKEKITLSTKLSINECLHCLKENTIHGFSFAFKGINGTFKGNKFKLSKQTWWYKNSWAITYMGELQSDGKETKIIGYFGFDPLVKLFSILFTIVIFTMLVLMISSKQYGAVYLLLMSLVFIWFLGPALGKLISFSHKSKILEFLTKTLNAQQIENS